MEPSSGIKADFAFGFVVGVGFRQLLIIYAFIYAACYACTHAGADGKKMVLTVPHASDQVHDVPARRGSA